MKKTTKFLSLFTLVLCLVMALSVTASAAEPASGTWGGIDWTLTEDGTLTIAPTVNEITKKKPWSGEYYQRGEIPAAINDAITFTVAPPWDRSAVKTLIIEEGVTSIGSFALQDHTNLTGELVLPSTLTYIGQQGLQHADQLEKLTFAKGGTETLCIGVQSLAYMKTVKEVLLPDDRPVHVHCWVFKGCDNLEAVYFPASVEVIGYNTHYDWQNKNVRESFIFNFCPKLKDVAFGSQEVYDMFTGFHDWSSGMSTAIKNKIKNDPTIAPVALVNGEFFSTIEAAFVAAEDGDTITLLKNVAPAAAITVDKDVTLDLNGKTLTLPVLDNYAVVIKDSLTIIDSSAAKTGKVVNNDDYALGFGLSTSCTGGLYIKGGNFESFGEWPYLIGAFGGEVVIEGGNFEVDYSVVNSFEGYNASVSITGGTFVNHSEWAAYFTAMGDNVAISGGTYNAAIIDEYLAEGFTTKSIGNGMYGIAPIVAKIGETSYATFKEAYNAAQAGDTIVLLETAVLDSSFNYASFDKAITIDGSNLDVAIKSEAKDVAFKNLTVKGTVEVRGQVTLYIYSGTYDGFLYDFSQNVDIQGGTFNGYNPEKHVISRNFAAVANGDVYTVVPSVAAIGTRGYATLKDACAAAEDGKTIRLLRDVTTSEIIKIEKSITLDGNGKTITYTGSNRAIEIPNNADAEVNVTIKNLTVDFAASYCERGINYNDDGALTLQNVTVNGANVTYALNMPGSSDNAVVVIEDSALTGKIALNVWGENAAITANNTVFTSVDNTAAENYAAVKLNNDGSTYANGTTITINGGKIIAKDEKGAPSRATSNATATGTIVVSETTEVIGTHDAPVAIVTYASNPNQFYSCSTLQAAIDKAIATNGNVKLIADVTASEIIVVNGSVIIDGNGKTLTSTAGRAINVETAGNVTIKNLIIKASGERAINVIQKPANLTIDNVTATAANYTVNLASSAGAAKVAITNSNLTGLNVVNVGAAGAYVTVDNTTLNCADNNTAEGYSVLALNKDAKGGSIIANNVTFNFTGSAGEDSRKATNQAAGGTVTIDGSTDEVQVSVAYISYGNYWYGFTTLEGAVAKAKETGKDTIVLLRTIKVTEDTTLDLTGINVVSSEGMYDIFDIRNGATLTINGGNFDSTPSDCYVFYIGSASKGAGHVVINDGTFKGACSVAQVNVGTLTINGGNFSATPSDADGSYEFLINCKDDTRDQCTVTITGGTFANFNPANNAAEGEKTNFCATGYRAEKNGDGTYTVKMGIAKVSNGTTTKYYKTLQEALDKTPKYYTVTLFEDYTGDDALVVGTNNKAATDGITINLNGYELKAGIKVDSPSAKFTLTLKNGTVNGNIEANDGVTLTGVTVNGDIEVNDGTCTIKADAAVTGDIKVAGKGILKITDGAMINGEEFAVAKAQSVNIDAAAYVLNYQSKAVYGYYGTVEQAFAAAAKYYTVVLMDDATVTETVTITTSITVKLNGNELANQENIVVTGSGKVTIK